MDAEELIKRAKDILLNHEIIEDEHYREITRGDGAVILEVAEEYRKPTKEGNPNKRDKDIVTVWHGNDARLTIKGSSVYAEHRTPLGENDISDGLYEREIWDSYKGIAEPRKKKK